MRLLSCACNPATSGEHPQARSLEAVSELSSTAPGYSSTVLLAQAVEGGQMIVTNPGLLILQSVWRAWEDHQCLEDHNRQTYWQGSARANQARRAEPLQNPAFRVAGPFQKPRFRRTTTLP